MYIHAYISLYIHIYIYIYIYAYAHRCSRFLPRLRVTSRSCLSHFTVTFLPDPPFRIPLTIWKPFGRGQVPGRRSYPPLPEFSAPWKRRASRRWLSSTDFQS